MAGGRVEYFLQTLVNYISHWIDRNIPMADAIKRATEKFGRRANLYTSRASVIAQQAVDNSRRANTLDRTRPISEVLGGQAPYGSTVAVRVLVEYQYSDTGEMSKASRVIEAPWNFTLEAIYNLAWRGLQQENAYLRDAEPIDFSTIPPMYYPHSTTQ